MTRSRFSVARCLSVAVVMAALGACADDNPGHGAEGEEAPGADVATEETATEPPRETAASTPTVPPLHPSVDDYPEALVTLSGDDLDVEIAVKLADDPDRREHGLMEVEDLPPGTGMLFVFDGERNGGFWMKNTLVPLDIAYADADGEIVSILAMEPCVADPCEVYDPGAAYQRALEVPQGWFGEVGVEVGDTLDFEPLERDR
ncbi:MAG: DUF192 domain-containing protein [Actinobacteria bacterium]|jgi:uncharacterized membrane protein (UPF0127 family)|nr:DUF192 domain-containing protein [Actinomycetota bacterium]